MLSERASERTTPPGLLSAFPACLLDRQLVNRQDLAIAEEHVIKPFDPEVLLSRVNAVFRRLKVMAA